MGCDCSTSGKGRWTCLCGFVQTTGTSSLARSGLDHSLAANGAGSSEAQDESRWAWRFSNSQALGDLVPRGCSWRGACFPGLVVGAPVDQRSATFAGAIPASCWCASVIPSNNPSGHKLGGVSGFFTESSRLEWMDHHELSRFDKTAEKVTTTD